MPSVRDMPFCRATKIAGAEEDVPAVRLTTPGQRARPELEEAATKRTSSSSAKIHGADPRRKGAKK